MPVNFPEIWAKRVIHNLETKDKAPWLDGISELSADVHVINEGAKTEMNKIHVAETDFEVDVLFNNNTYPIAAQKYEDGTIEITLDKLQTKVTTVSDDQVMGASYDKIDAVTEKHTRGLNVNKYMKAIHSIAPQEKTDKTPILVIAGDKLTRSDIANLKRECDKAKFGGKDYTRRLVLTSKHYNDLLDTDERFANMVVNFNEGTVAPKLYGFEIFEYDGMPLYDANDKKKPFGSAELPTDREASVVFIKERIAKKTGKTKQYFASAKDDPENQTNRLSYRHYFIATPFQNRGVGAILDKAAE